MVPDDWCRIRLGEALRCVDERLGEREPPPVLSVTKDRGVCLQEESGRRLQLGADVTRYKVMRRGQFGMAPMALYYGAIGRLSAVETGITSPAYEVFEARENVDPEYMAHLLRAPWMVQRYGRLSRGGNRSGKRKVTDFSDLASLQVALPPRAEQAAVVVVLRQITQQLEASEGLLAGIAKQKRSVMARLLVGDRGVHRRTKPLGERWVFGRVVEDVERIPADWALIRLTSVAKLESGHTPSRQHPEYWGGPHPWLSLADSAELRNLVVRETLETIADEGLANSSARLLPAGTVVFSRTAVIGQTAMLGQPTATSQDFVAFVCGPRVDPRYLTQAFRHMGREWARLKAGSSPTNKTLYFSMFQVMQVLLPPRQEQALIADVGEAFDLRITAERAHLDALRELKRGLADALLSGRVRLRPHRIAAFANGAADAGN